MRDHLIHDVLNDKCSHNSRLVAQVLIRCREVFCIKDCDTGKIVQGFDDIMPRDVPHLVRFEMVVRESTDDELEIGRWQIVDWDDLLEGNIFFA